MSFRQNEINDRLDRVGVEIVNKFVSYREFFEILVENFNGFDTKLNINHYAEFTPKQKELNRFYATLMGIPFNMGFAYIYDTFGRDEIHINFMDNCFNIYLNSWQWLNLKFVLSRGLQHEFVHQNQAIRTKYRIDSSYPIMEYDADGITTEKSYMEYLKNVDELEARAHDLTLELTSIPRANVNVMLKTIEKDIQNGSDSLTYTGKVYNLYCMDNYTIKWLTNQVKQHLDNGVHWVA